MFYPVSIEKMHELKNQFTMCTLTRDDTNPAIWFAQLNKIRQKLIDDYKLTTYEDSDVLQHIMYNTKPFMYQIILGINKDRLAHEIKRHEADNTFQITVIRVIRPWLCYWRVYLVTTYVHQDLHH
jgi:hypothetical protein